MTAPLEGIFQAKYEEFASSLLEIYPELTTEIKASIALSKEDRVAAYKAKILPVGGRPAKPPTECPGEVLPGVLISEEKWNSETEGTKNAVNQFLSLLTFSIMMNDGNSEEFGGPAFEKWANSFMDDFRGKLNREDFDSFTSRFADLFGSGGSRLPPFPERLRKGKLVQLAEEIVRELKPEELGLDPEVVKQCEADPSKAFEILMSTTMRNPAKLQEAMKRIIKRLQDKFQKGHFKPQELAAEAEEMMKEFSENPQFVSMMESFRNMFGATDMKNARATGQDQSARMEIVKERLRRAQAAKEAARGQSRTHPSTGQPAPGQPPRNTMVVEEDEGFASIQVKSKKGKAKQEVPKVNNDLD